MQYTESNLGIPEERVQYLARVAQWLVTDWAAAQSHLPDQFRSLYPRILTRLALKLHFQGRSECLSSEATEMIKAWLPEYGYNEDDADAVLAGLLTRTGILVRDVPQMIIFSQFGLQEYYASIDFLERVSEEQFVQFANAVWWREVILLAIAQQKEPTTYVNQLFLVNPLLAAEAVAESPTPSIALQRRAINACLEAVDRELQTSRSATVRLLRKVNAVLEEYLISELETRLQSESVAQHAGLVLALAGTPAATVALARHPSVWGTCLQNAGYLSSGLENLLITWIRDGDDAQTRHASDLLRDRLSSDRFQQLIALLPTLSVPKADYVSRMLLAYIQGRSLHSRLTENDTVSQIAICVARLQQPIHVPKMVEPEVYRMDSVIQIVRPAIALKYSKPHLSSHHIETTLINSISWATQHGLLICWFGSSLITISMGAGRFSRIGAFLGTAIALYGISLPRLDISSKRTYWRGLPSITILSLVCVGAALFSIFQQGGIIISGPTSPARLSILAGVCGLLGFIRTFSWFPWDMVKAKPAEIARIAGLLMVVVSLVSFFLSPWMAVMEISFSPFVGMCSLGTFVICGYRLHSDYNLTMLCLNDAERTEKPDVSSAA